MLSGATGNGRSRNSIKMYFTPNSPGLAFLSAGQCLGKGDVLPSDRERVVQKGNRNKRRGRARQSKGPGSPPSFHSLVPQPDWPPRWGTPRAKQVRRWELHLPSPPKHLVRGCACVGLLAALAADVQTSGGASSPLGSSDGTLEPQVGGREKAAAPRPRGACRAGSERRGGMSVSLGSIAFHSSAWGKQPVPQLVPQQAGCRQTLVPAQQARSGQAPSEAGGVVR